MGMSRKKKLAAAVVLLLIVAAAGCSPEYTRVRGGGAGADVGNRTLGPSIQLHGPVNPAFDEPARGKAIELSK